MKKWRRFWVMLLIAGLVGAAAGPAWGDCIKTGRVRGSYFDISVNPKAATFYLGTTQTPTYYYEYTTTDANIIDLLTGAQVANQRVTITGDAAVCESAGLTRNGGVIKKVQRYLLR